MHQRVNHWHQRVDNLSNCHLDMESHCMAGSLKCFEVFKIMSSISPISRILNDVKFEWVCFLIRSRLIYGLRGEHNGHAFYEYPKVS